jgi:tricarballylate dehydrogenase
VQTVRSFSDAVQDGPFDATRPDGKTTAGIAPPKSNWAQRLDSPPFLCYPLACAIVFTYGGIATDTSARVIDGAGEPIAGLYAAGECTGIYYGHYPGGTSVLRGMVFGRIAGLHAARLLVEARAAGVRR